MSGLAGFWRFDSKPADAAHLERMLLAIRHRGPDSVGAWSSEALRLGHRLIASASDRSPLPYIHSPSGLVVTADARLDNAGELAAELGIEYRSLPADPAARDAELILAAYRKWGANCPDRLLGDFAFAIWDPGNRRLFLARDHIGLRPLIFYHSPKLFAFGSEAKALLAHPDIPKVLNRARVADYLVPWLEGFSFDSTFFENVYRLAPGSTLTITPETRHPRAVRWFHLDADGPELRLPSDRDYQQAFLEQFTAAVDRGLQRPGAVGSMLSGGLDSSSICAVAQGLLADRGKGDLPVFSAVSSGDSGGFETQAIEAVIRHTGVDVHRLLPDQLKQLEIETANAFRHSDDPFDFEITIIPALFAAAARAGCTSLMTGVDGDISAGASGRYLIYMLRSGKWFSAMRETIGLARNTGHRWRGAGHLLAFSIRSTLAPRTTRRRHRQRKLVEVLDSSMIRREFADEVDVNDRLGQIFDSELPYPEPRSLRHRHATLIQAPLLSVALERYDRGAHRFSIEAVHPFCDRRFVEFALSLPVNQRAGHGWRKWILRQAIGDRLPSQARWRRENDNVNEEFARATLAQLIKEATVSKSDPFRRVRPFIDPARLSEVDSGGRTADSGVIMGEKRHQLRRSLILNQWLEERFQQ